MEVKIIKEAGYIEAMQGIGLSYGVTDFKRLEQVACTLAHRGKGHSKFLESIQVWLEVRAPRYWWSQADTYRVAVTKQSESTMHTLTRREMIPEDCTSETPRGSIDVFNDTLRRYHASTGEIKKKLYKSVVSAKPEGFMQKRIVATNYKTLQNIVAQRTGHKLDEWRVFIEVLRSGLEHPNFIFRENEK